MSARDATRDDDPDYDAVPELIENLEHPHPEVRAWALHAMACEPCK